HLAALAAIPTAGDRRGGPVRIPARARAAAGARTGLPPRALRAHVGPPAGRARRKAPRRARRRGMISLADGHVVIRPEETSMNALQQLRQIGQSLWLDQITREMLDDGTLAGYIRDLGLTGL